MTDNAPPLVELQDVTKRFASPEGGEGPAVLEGISLTVREGEALAVVGPSGSGKSTLLNIIGTLDRPTSGRVRLAGDDLSAMDDEALAAVRTRRIGFVFQLHHLLPQCTALENVLVPAMADASAVPPEVADRGRGLLERVGLADRMTYRPGHLSGGERQRVAVARALINRPALLLADEPTGNLDWKTGRRILELIRDLHLRKGLSSIVVTHNEKVAAFCDRTVVMEAGTLRVLPLSA